MQIVACLLHRKKPFTGNRVETISIMWSLQILCIQLTTSSCDMQLVRIACIIDTLCNFLGICAEHNCVLAMESMFPYTKQCKG
jgi:hypothetical protein